MPKEYIIRPKGEFPNKRFKHKNVKCNCGNHSHNKKRILWKQGRHKTNKSIKFKEE